MAYSARSYPMLDEDGVTIRMMVGCQTDDGVLYDGMIEIQPGDERYDELLPEARLHPFPKKDETPVDPDAIAKLMARHTHGRAGGSTS